MLGLTARHPRACIAMARAQLRWRRNEWASALFTDESTFNTDDPMVALGCTGGEGKALIKHVSWKTIASEVGQ